MTASNDNNFSLLLGLHSFDRCQVTGLLEQIVGGDDVLLLLPQGGEPGVEVRMQSLRPTVRQYNRLGSERYLDFAMRDHFKRLIC